KQKIEKIAPNFAPKKQKASPELTEKAFLRSGRERKISLKCLIFAQLGIYALRMLFFCVYFCV
ncbi:MAG: hypothetical protein MI975_08895, partial [Cytophagales bacterium]|nr:hypothetical protein [Cytophagales bacterium]